MKVITENRFPQSIRYLCLYYYPRVDTSVVVVFDYFSWRDHMHSNQSLGTGNEL